MVTGNNLKDVYVADGGRIINVKTDFGDASVSWTEIDADEAAEITGYQVDYTETPDPPQKGINDLPVLKVPYETKSNLSARKVYYVWVRAVNKLNQVSPWVNSSFSPKPEKAAFIVSESMKTAEVNKSDGTPKYTNFLKVEDKDAAWYVIQRQKANGAELYKFPPVAYQDMAGMGFYLADSANLEKHGQYNYSVYTMNALNEPSETQTLNWQVQNLEPQPGTVNPGWRRLEVKTGLNLQLGPKNDPEGDPLTYYLYVRTPGAQDERLIGQWAPQNDNEVKKVTFADNTAFEWQIRSSDAPYGSKQIAASNSWGYTRIDTKGLIINIENDFGEAWGTKKQPLDFRIEKNPDKTYTDYQLDFGDGTGMVLNEGQTVTHTYTDLNTYQLTVTARDALGQQHRGQTDLEIIPTYKGILYDNEVWSEECVVKDSVVIPERLTLTIMPGVTLQMQAQANIVVKGTLNAIDSSGAAAIRFDWQAYNNPWEGIQFKGDSRGDLWGVAISHADRGILVESVGSLSLNQVEFSDNQVGLDYYDGTVVANNCDFYNNQPTGVYCRSDYLYPILINCVFEGNKEPYKDRYGVIDNQDDLNDNNYFPGNSGNQYK